MQITAQMVKELREKTAAGMMDCKKALTESNGDFEAAVDYLRAKGMAAAAKKAGRITSEGLVSAWISDDHQNAVVAEINCESDFVAKNEDFIQFAHDFMKHVWEKNPADMDECNAQMWINDESKTVKDTAAGLVGTIGENISPRRFARYEVSDAGVLDTYIHMGGKLGVVIELGLTNAENANNAKLLDTAHKLSMQIAAAMPIAVTPEGISADVIEREKAIYLDQVKESNKPEKMWDKIIEGKLNKFFKEACLINQIWVHDQETPVSKVLEALGKEIGDTVTIRRFDRLQLGEGLEKRSNDLAAEVEEQLKG